MALVGFLTDGATFGTGYEQARAAVEGHASTWSFLPAKFVATLVMALREYRAVSSRTHSPSARGWAAGSDRNEALRHRSPKSAHAGEHLARRAEVDVALVIVGEVLPRERSVLTDSDTCGSIPCLVDEPTEHLAEP